MVASILEAVLMGIVTGYIFFDLGRDQAGIRSRQGGLYTASGLQGYLILLFEVYRMTIDMPTFDRESSDNCVDALPFVLSRRLARLPTEDLPVPFIFSVLVYFMAGFERSVSKFFIFFAITLVNQYVSVCCAMTCVVAVRHFAGASLIANLAYTIQSIACGMFVQVNTIPVYVRWLKWTAYNVSRRTLSLSVYYLSADTSYYSFMPLVRTPATNSRATFTTVPFRAAGRIQAAISTMATT
jgi:hypothetical protein